jgi:hypothetical protein
MRSPTSAPLDVSFLLLKAQALQKSGVGNAMAAPGAVPGSDKRWVVNGERLARLECVGKDHLILAWCALPETLSCLSGIADHDRQVAALECTYKYPGLARRGLLSFPLSHHRSLYSLLSSLTLLLVAGRHVRYTLSDSHASPGAFFRAIPSESVNMKLIVASILALAATALAYPAVEEKGKSRKQWR